MTVRIPEALAVDIGGVVELVLDVSSEASLADVLSYLGAQYPALLRRLCDETGAVRRFVNIFIGLEECRTLGGREARVPQGTEILIVGSVAGG